MRSRRGSRRAGGNKLVILHQAAPGDPIRTSWSPRDPPVGLTNRHQSVSYRGRYVALERGLCSVNLHAAAGICSTQQRHPEPAKHIKPSGQRPFIRKQI